MDYALSTNRSWRAFWLWLPLLAIGWALLGVLRVPPILPRTGQSTSPRAVVNPTADLKFSVRGCLFTNQVTVAMSTGAAGGTIHYTVDGSEPTSSSPEYREPVRLANTTLLRAQVFASRTPISLRVSETYIAIDPDLAGFNSNLPLVILNSFVKPIPHDTRVPVSVRVIGTREGKNDRAELAGLADFAGRGELNLRGNTSLRYPKRSYHLKTRAEDETPLKASILGFPKESDWVLYAPYPDKTLMRDVLAYELSNRIGRYAARTRFVEVFLNEGGGRLTRRNYLGVYVFEEKIKRSKNRVPIQKLTPQDNSEPGISGGYIIKKDHTERADMQEGFVSALSRSFSVKMQRFHSSQGNVFFYVEPNGAELTSAQKSWIRRHLNNFESVLYGENFRDPRTGYPGYIDVGSFIDHHWLVELTKNIDGFRFSTYYHKDRGGKIVMGPIWDYNLSFGNANARDGYDPNGWYWPQLDDRQYSWFRRLFDDPDFAQLYADRWGELRANQFSASNLLSRVDFYASLLNESQARNFRRWPILGRNVNPNMFVGQSYREEIDWMKKWIQQRVAWIDRQFLAAPAFSIPEGRVDSGATLILRAASGRIYYTLNGADPRASGGGLARGALQYTAPVVLKEDATVCCRVYQGRKWSCPAVAKYTVGGGSSSAGTAPSGAGGR